MIFKNLTDEDQLCNVLRAYVEEFGPEAVSVYVPKTWKDHGYEHTLGRVYLDYTTENSVEIVARYAMGSYYFKVELI